MKKELVSFFPCLSFVSVYPQAKLMQNNYQDKMEMIFTYSVQI